jgi:hypothetical protein
VKKITLIFSILLLSFNAWSQSYVDSTGADRFASTRALDDFNSLKNNNVEEEETELENIKGSMYFNTSFEESTVVFNGNPVEEKALLRYNSFKDEIEIGKNSNQKRPSNILVKTINVEAQIGDEYFKPFALNPKDKDKLTYLVKIYSNEQHKLYLHKMKKFVDEKPAPSGFGGSLPARFDDKFTLYYSSKAEGTLSILKVNKKSILKLFPNHLGPLKGFISENNLKFKTYQDVIFLFNNFTSLQ